MSKKLYQNIDLLVLQHFTSLIDKIDLRVDSGNQYLYIRDRSIIPTGGVGGFRGGARFFAVFVGGALDSSQFS